MLIRVNPESVQGYGREAEGIFDAMHNSLVDLVNKVVDVRYFGPNAVAFKTECGTLAADFANKLHLDMGAMADAVRTSTSNIAASLGGAPIVIKLDAKPISPPVPETVDFVDVDTAALEGLLPVVNQQFGALRENLTMNLNKLQSTDWEGNAKLVAVDAVGGFTSAAHQKCTTAQQTITSYITGQIEAVMAADR